MKTVIHILFSTFIGLLIFFGGLAAIDAHAQKCPAGTKLLPVEYQVVVEVHKHGHGYRVKWVTEHGVTLRTYEKVPLEVGSQITHKWGCK